MAWSVHQHWYRPWSENVGTHVKPYKPLLKFWTSVRVGRMALRTAESNVLLEHLEMIQAASADFDHMIWVVAQYLKALV